jgi:hypothetical protein
MDQSTSMHALGLPNYGGGNEVDWALSGMNRTTGILICIWYLGFGIMFFLFHLALFSDLGFTDRLTWKKQEELCSQICDLRLSNSVIDVPMFHSSVMMIWYISI